MRRIALALALASCPLLGCALFADEPEVAPDLERGVSAVESEAVIDFFEQASSFYQRLAHRRFNTISTYRDEELRKHFRTERDFSDYYADLADALHQGHFERSRPLALSVDEVVIDGPGQARVRVTIGGENGQPLRWWGTEIAREDRWERREGAWWIVPGKL